MIKVLALSSSRAGNSGYLEPAIPYIKDFLGDQPLQIAFVPFATTGTHDDYLARVTKALKELPYTIEVVRGAESKDLLNRCDAILTGGGNTFKLLHDLYQYDLLELIRERVKGGLPYIGWSAGSNILGATIKTTNDMPIVYPSSFDALGIFPFQINPHYYFVYVPGFNGETRDDRLTEFLVTNPEDVIIAIPEGCALIAESGSIVYQGTEGGYRFTLGERGVEKRMIAPGSEVAL